MGILRGGGEREPSKTNLKTKLTKLLKNNSKILENEKDVKKTNMIKL